MCQKSWDSHGTISKYIEDSSVAFKLNKWSVTAKDFYVCKCFVREDRLRDYGRTINA